jgi:hypothetical protein
MADISENEEKSVKRFLLLWSVAFLALGVVAVGTAGLVYYARADVSTVGELRFENEPRIPPVLEPYEEGNRRVFDLTVQDGRAELLPGRRTETWGAKTHVHNVGFADDREFDLVASDGGLLETPVRTEWGFSVVSSSGAERC